MTRNKLSFTTTSLLLIFLAGCGGERTYQLSGNVTFQGKPVPAGQIVFEPAAGNSGAPGFAKIKDGHYDTGILDGQGVIGGPHVVRIHGRDGIRQGELLNGLQLFPDYTAAVDLPKKSGTLDFDVPAQAKTAGP
jgi:hypothetical protein